MANSYDSANRHVFVIVKGGVAEVDITTIPRDVAVEVIDLDDVAADPSAPKQWSRHARAYAKLRGLI